MKKYYKRTALIFSLGASNFISSTLFSPIERTSYYFEMMMHDVRVTSVGSEMAAEK